MSSCVGRFCRDSTSIVGPSVFSNAAANAPAVSSGSPGRMGDDKLKVIAAKLITKVRQSVTIDWTLRESARAKIKVMVKRILNKYGYPPDLQEEAVNTVLMQAELLCADWVKE
jgi:type I restriction enzyme R subunit